MIQERNNLWKYHTLCDSFISQFLNPRSKNGDFKKWERNANEREEIRPDQKWRKWNRTRDQSANPEERRESEEEQRVRWEEGLNDRWKQHHKKKKMKSEIYEGWIVVEEDVGPNTQFLQLLTISSCSFFLGLNSESLKFLRLFPIFRTLTKLKCPNFTNNNFISTNEGWYQYQVLSGLIDAWPGLDSDVVGVLVIPGEAGGYA